MSQISVRTEVRVPTQRTRATDTATEPPTTAAAARPARRRAVAVVRACRAGAARLRRGLERLGRETHAAAARGLTP